ncbi:hypothetical protein DXG01_012155 [Tephrocybe rancida]|nr:hypothetical protein DXG01_012155 [Tephrocybe rancida]
MLLIGDKEIDVTKFKIEEDGSFKRPVTVFRNFIEKGGKFEPEADRYHLYVSLACPWALGALISRKLKGLEDLISVTFVSPRMTKTGWPFANIDDYPGADVDTLNGSGHVKDIYFKVDEDSQGSGV